MGKRLANILEANEESILLFLHFPHNLNRLFTLNFPSDFLILMNFSFIFSSIFRLNVQEPNIALDP